MKTSIIIHCLCLSFIVCHEGLSQAKIDNAMNTFKVRHSVVFTLKYPKGSAEETTFLDAARKLSSIPGVNRFECLREISRNNSYDYGLSMEFDSSQAYEAYLKHPDHEAFVQAYWAKYVKDFMEIDYEPY